MLNSLGLGFIFRAKDEASEAVEKLKSGMEHLHEAAEKTNESIWSSMHLSGKAVAAFTGVVAIGAASIFEMAEHAERFSDSILRAGVASHASKEQMEELEKFAHDKALDSLSKSAIEVADTLQELAKEGFNVNEQMQAVDATMRLMKFSSLEARDASSLVHDTLTEFGMGAEQSGELVDKLAFAMREFHFRAEELRPSMAGLAAGAHLANASFDDTLIGLGIMKDAFPNATKSAMAMNIALQQLASTNTQKELRGIGVTVRDTQGHIRPLLEIIQDLSSKTAKYTDAQLANKLATIGSARAAGGLSVIIDQLRKGVKDSEGNLVTGGAALDVYRNKLANTSGTAKEMVDVMNDTFGASVLKLKAAISNLGVEIGSGFEVPLKNAVQTLNLFFRGVTQLISQGGFSGEIKDELDKADNQGLKGFLINLYVWGNRIKNFLDSLGASFKAAFAPYQPVLDAVADSLKEVGTALGLTNQTAQQNGDAFDTAGEAGAGLGEVLGNLAGIISFVLLTAVDLLGAAVINMKLAWAAVGPTIMNVVQVLKGALEIIGGLLTGDWSLLWNGFVDVVVGASKIVVNLLFALVKMIIGVGDAIFRAFGVQPNNMGEMINDVQKELMAKVELGTTVLKASPATSPGVAASAASKNAAAAEASTSTVTEPEQHIHLHTSVHLDGEKVGEAQARAKRSSDSRSFMSVPVAAGAY